MQNLMGGGDGSKLRYKGGELIGLRSDILPGLLKCYSELWKFNYKRYEEKQVKLNEEAHFLSIIYHQLGFDDSIANKYIKRMWTAVKCDNIVAGDENLPLWHLPAEKKYAFGKMFDFLCKSHTEEEYINCLRKMLDIPGSKYIRMLKKCVAKINEKF